MVDIWIVLASNGTLYLYLCILYAVIILFLYTLILKWKRNIPNKFIFVFFWQYLSSIFITKRDSLDILNIIFHNLVSTLNIDV